MNYKDITENINITDHQIRAREIAEESYDDIEEDGYMDYTDEVDLDEDETEEYYEPIDVLNVSEHDDIAVIDKDWVNNGLNKKYEGSFDKKKAEELFNSTGSDIKNDQIESIRYATYFARKGNNDAKNFIVSIMQQKDKCVSGYVYNLAQTSFYLFFRNYVRKSVEAFYDKQMLSGSDKADRYQDAMNECFAMLLGNISTYDSNKGQLTTYFKNYILGALNEWEAHRKSRPSKGTMATDKIVGGMRNKLIAEGISNPSPRLIALKADISVNAVLNSLQRIESENTAISTDSEGGQFATGKTEQKLFESPEKAFIHQEEHSYIMDMLDILTETEKAVLLAMNGLEQIGSTLLESEHDDDDSIIKIARYLGIKSNDVKRIYTDAIQKIRAANGIKNKKDRLLSGRTMTFAKDKRDDIAAEYIDDLSDIFDIEKYNKTKTYKKGDCVAYNNVFYTSLRDDNDKELDNEKFWVITSDVLELENA